MIKSLKIGNLIPVTLLNNPRTSCPLIYFDFSYHTLHNLVKALFFRFLSAQILSFYFLYFYTLQTYFLISEVIPQIFNPTLQIVIPIGIPTKEAKAEIETHPVTVEIKISKRSI